MNQSPAQRHRLRVLAAKQARQAADSNPYGETVGTAYELQQAQLYEFKKRLRACQSLAGKIKMKRAFLPCLDDYLDAVLAANPGTQDSVLMTAMVWNIDAGSYERAMQLAEYAVRHDLQLPDPYQRNLPTTLQDEVADAVLRGELKGDAAVQTVGRVLQLTDTLDSHDQAKAKLYKAAGYALLGKTSSCDADIKQCPIDACAQALALLRQAMQLHAGIGVKKDIERLQARLKAAGLTAQQAP